jgi:CDP-glycerol glycerophosphotransferase (TagB/SpsB family)
VFRFVFFPLYLISFFTPREKTIWLFGSSQDRFSENAKALFLHIAQDSSQTVTPVWISGNAHLVQMLRDNGYLAYRRWSFKGILFGLRAKYYFYNSYTTDINFYTSGHAVLVNLWHGIPLKQIEFDIENGPLYKMYHTRWSYLYRFIKPYAFQRPSYVLSTAQAISNLFASAFRIPRSHCIPLGYPRNDLFFMQDFFDIDKQTETTILAERLMKLKQTEQKILIYMPTWRSNNKTFFSQAIPDCERLNKILKEKSLTLVIKPHPNTPSIEKTYSNIIFITSKVDIYTVLPSSDYLITDYSSIYFDYLLLDKEIIFYAFDYEAYVHADRKLYFDYLEKTPGKKIFNFEDLLQTFSRLEDLDYEHDRKKIKDEFWSFQDGNASDRIYRYFVKHMQETSA